MLPPKMTNDLEAKLAGDAAAAAVGRSGAAEGSEVETIVA
jgi:hypothetical protein